MKVHGPTLQVSVLMKKKFEDLESFTFAEVVTEFMDRNHNLFRLVLVSMLPSNKLLSLQRIQEILPRIGLVYGVIMQTNFQELSAVQTVMSMTLEDNIVDRKVSYSTSTPMLYL